MNNIKITEHPKLVRTVFARDLHKFLEVKTKYADWISRMLDYGFIEDVDYVKGVMFNAKEVFLNFGKNPNSYNGRPPQEYHLTIDAAKEISMLQRTEKGKEARRYFIECERNLKEKTSTNKTVVSMIDLSNPADVIRGLNELTALWLKKEEENKELIRIKAWIGNKREATAMATAANLSKKVNKLEDELGKGKNFKEVKAITWLSEYFYLEKSGCYSQIGKALKNYCKDNGYEVITIDNTNFGSVKAYHVKGIESFKRYLDYNLEPLIKYRKWY